MYTSPKPLFHKALIKPAAFIGLLPVFTVLLTQCCSAQQPSLLSLTSPSQTEVEWTSGPAEASLGSLANIKIPKDYRLTGTAGASVLLTRMHNPVPDGLVGILAPESGQWWAVLTYKNIGYVKNVDSKIDAAAILKAISDNTRRQNEERTIHGLSPIVSVDWKIPPVFVAKAHTLEWAVLAKTGSAEVVNHTMRLLGRQGVLDATVVEPYQASSDLAPLKELMKNISFKPGQRYVDFQKGDTVSDVSLAGLIIGGDDSLAAQKNDVAASSNKASSSAAAWSWYMYVFAGVLAGGVALLFRGLVRRRRHKVRHAHSARPAANAIGNGSGTGDSEGTHVHASVTSPPSALPGNDLEPDSVKPGAVASKEALAGNGSNHRRSRRKKVFDYHRFYTDTVMKLSSGTYTEFSTSNGRANGNGHANGHSVDRAMESQPPTYGDTNQALVQAHLDLIANQKELIEEQKRLMIQQAKLIEEKSKLIAEKSQLLDRQTELFERDLL